MTWTGSGTRAGVGRQWRRWCLAALAGTAAMATTAAIVFGAPKGGPATFDPLEAAIQSGWQSSWQTESRAGRQPGSAHARLWIEQDSTQRACTLHGNHPPDREAIDIMQREWASIVYPADGAASGDWGRGEVYARGSVLDIRHTETHPPSDGQHRREGQCLACHHLDRRDDTARKSGPSLVGYGLARGANLHQSTLLYEQIYNSNAVIACSVMPRYGPHKVLTPEQIRDIVAYLLAPQSPVNAGQPRVAGSVVAPLAPQRP